VEQLFYEAKSKQNLRSAADVILAHYSVILDVGSFEKFSSMAEVFLVLLCRLFSSGVAFILCRLGLGVREL